MNSFQVPLLSRLQGLRHVFVGRGPAPRPDPARLIPLLEAGDAVRRPLARLRQIHSNRCHVVGDADPIEDGVVGDGDALATAAPGVPLGVATADCLPLVAFDPEARALAVVHAGWRGTLEGVLVAALHQIQTNMGARAHRIVMGAGPAVGPCCYRVGDEVIDAFAAKHASHMPKIAIPRGPGVTHLDLLEANRLQAIDAGVDPTLFGSLGICTVCQPALTHSYRRDGSSAGRMWALAMIVE